MAESEGLAPCGRLCYALPRSAVEPDMFEIEGSNFILFRNRATLPCSAPSNRMAESEGFEPSIRVNVYTLSRGAPSATRPALLILLVYGK